MPEVTRTVLVFDACALIAYLKGETGADQVANMLCDPTNDCFTHALNICEVYYTTLKVSDKATAQGAISRLKADGITIRSDVDLDFLEAVAEFKVTLPLGQPPLADCFCMALCKRLSGEVVTGDHADFDKVSAKSILAVRFIR